LFQTDSIPLCLLLEFGLEPIGALTNHERIGLLDIIFQCGGAFNERFKLTLECHPRDLFFSGRFERINDWSFCGHGNNEFGFADDGGSDIPTIPMFGAHMISNSLESTDESISLLVVAAVKYMTLQLNAVSSKLGDCGTFSKLGDCGTLWSVTTVATATACATATLV
jgi:hypothetical protein